MARTIFSTDSAGATRQYGSVRTRFPTPRESFSAWLRPRPGIAWRFRFRGRRSALYRRMVRSSVPRSESSMTTMAAPAMPSRLGTTTPIRHGSTRVFSAPPSWWRALRMTRSSLVPAPRSSPTESATKPYGQLQRAIRLPITSRRIPTGRPLTMPTIFPVPGRVLGTTHISTSW